LSRKTVKEKINLTELTVPAFGYELIREDFIEEILGEDAPSILYWIGKQIARKYPLFSFDEIQEFFRNAGWGNLDIISQKKSEIELQLTSDLVKHRILTRTNATFQLEAGFLAEQIAQQKKVYAETFEHPKKKDGKVLFTVKWDDIPLIDL
jgi:predicted hydrocarbon binding protein